MFVSSTLLMLICVTHFLLGGATYTEACRYVIDDEGLANTEAVLVRYTTRMKILFT